VDVHSHGTPAFNHRSEMQEKIRRGFRICRRGKSKISIWYPLSPLSLACQVRIMGDRLTKCCLLFSLAEEKYIITDTCLLNINWNIIIRHFFSTLWWWISLSNEILIKNSGIKHKAIAISPQIALFYYELL